MSLCVKFIELIVNRQEIWYELIMKKIRQPRYRQIAYLIAEQIINRQIDVGTKLHARSTLATTYGVSSETARKAISILADLGIVSTQQGSGVTITSRDKAKAFISQMQQSSDLKQLQDDVHTSIENQKQELTHLSNILVKLTERTEQMQRHNPLTPYELEMSEVSPQLGQSIGDMNFWQKTGATLVAIMHEGELVISPGPYSVIELHDIIYFVGSETSVQSVRGFFYDV